MTRGTSWTTGDHDDEIRKLLGYITSSVAAVSALDGATGPDARLRHEHVQDLLTDACELAYVVARARIAHMEPDDVHLRAEALDDATTGLEEIVSQARRGIDRLRTRPIAPVGRIVDPTRNGRFRDQINRLSFCATVA